MSKPYALTAVIGRFQPIHSGHSRIIKAPLEVSDHILILVGSANVARDTRNPFTAEERVQMIAHSFDDDDSFPDNVAAIDTLDDFPYDNAAWITQVQEKVAEWCKRLGLPPDAKIAITGHERDESSFYLKKFPQWTFLPAETDLLHINATALRHSYFLHGVKYEVCKEFEWLTPASERFLKDFATTDAYKELQAEHLFEHEYPKKWGPGPHQTVDNVVIQSGHLLVVERKKRPGKGLLALPGGHLELKETLDEAAVRELWEETRIYDYPDLYKDFDDAQRYEIMKTRLWPHYRARHRFDNPNRSRRARVITEAFLFKLPDEKQFPMVVGSDDAARAFWMPLSEVKPNLFFEDHGFIVKKMLGYL